MNYPLRINIFVKMFHRIFKAFHTYFMCFEKGQIYFKFCLPNHNNNKILYIIIIIIMKIKEIKSQILVGRFCLPNAYFLPTCLLLGKMVLPTLEAVLPTFKKFCLPVKLLIITILTV